ncbi:glycosyltransferase family 4 protein [Marimonas arenosa]|uniref:Glycosyltransferase family 4 protein n=1 Tax=Marimonas arenosa TaxID=1795305 RepID=A0AAE4B4M0_9RHOB|nr:glycosyltransferase family 1 protein [Marimonas arenosa]MDQ2090365.1 glycosyltransferase family 4 protein [Marimonas arenosa]
MMDNPIPGRLLDLSRLVSRAGRVLTGIDRVELAYLKAAVADKVPAWGLVRTPIGFLLLDARGMQGLADRSEGREPWGAASRLARVFGKLDGMQQRALSDMRRLATARTHKGGLARLLRRHLPTGFAYLNVGQSNLTDRVLHSVRHGAEGRIAVMIHDTIPLDHPLYQTPAAVERFRQMLKRVRAYADLVIYNSRATRGDAERHMEGWGAVPHGVVAHLGVDLAAPAPEDLPAGLPPDGAYFVTVGTIEPRKNHALLIEIWERLAKQTTPQEMPRLVICGARGWMNEEVFFRMDRSPLMGKHLHEAAGLSDGAVAALLEGAAGGLYPSFAEGYGLPAIEAAARGVPVICADLPATREILGDIPVYASPKDSYLWQRRIMALAKGRQAGRQADAEAFEPPRWTQHFNKVFSLT